MSKREEYDAVYFDSDDEDPPTQRQDKEVLNDEELMYDPELDDKDEDWVNKQIEKDSFNTTEEKTDAILSCPMCFTTLCYSCQRHEKYSNQFRAMFVRSCHVVKNERYKPKNASEDEYYYKVVCDTCGIQVAMMDEDEVYHFFNVIATSR
ncbi:E2F-associated phosphoprotein-domain-containing protein [Pilobolus umbonatus]|nr:E2F-associated phosphoprotein-domain-containing protein [Pilobolus umbonatus]